MKNLRIRKDRDYLGAEVYGKTFEFIYHVCKDYEGNLNLTEKAKKDGVIIETFRSESNAKLFLKALKNEIQ